MDITKKMAKEAYDFGQQSKANYNSLPDVAKKAYWQYGKDQGLVDPLNIKDPQAKNDFDSLVDKRNLVYGPTTTKVKLDYKTVDKDMDTKALVRTQSGTEYDRFATMKPYKTNQTPPPVRSTPKLTPAQKRVYSDELPTQNKPSQVKQSPSKNLVVGKGVSKNVIPQGKLAPKDLKRPDNPFAPALVNFTNTASLGLLERNTNVIDTLREKAPISSTLGSLVGYTLPFSTGNKLVKPLLKNITKPMLRNVTEGAIVGGGIQAIENTMQGKSLKQNAKETGAGMLIGAGVDAIAPLAGKALKPTVNKVIKSLTKTDLKLPNINPKTIKNNVLKPNVASQEVATTVENADSFMAKINVKANKKKATGLGLKMRTDLVDKLAPLEDAEKAIRGKIDSAEKSLYKTARNYFGTPEKAHEVIRTQLEPTLKAVQKQGYSIDELSAYAEAVHAKDVNLLGIKSGFTDAEIDDVIKKYSALEPQRLELQKVNNYVLDELVDGEVISKESADAMKAKWKNYMPLFRVMEDEKVEFGKGMGNTFANVASPIKTLKGSDKQVIDPISSMIKNIFQGVNAAERNKVGLQLANLALEDVDGSFIRKLADTEAVGRKNVLNIKQAGQNVKYEVNPELYKAMLGLDKEASNVLIRMLSKPASLLRAGATLTPEFAVRNPMRDVLSAYVTSKSGFNPFTDFGRGLASVLKKDELYSKFLMSNGAYGESISMDRNMHREILERVMKTPSKQFIDVVNGKTLIKVLRGFSDVTEKATKVGEFGKALKQGQTVEEAAYRARDLMDFARSGNSIKEANKVVAFLNANIQGKSKFLRAIKEDPAGVSARIGKAIALPSVAVFTAQNTYANEEQKAIIRDAPDWLRDTFWLLPVPFTNQVARIPKPFDFAVFGNTLERFLAYTVNNDKEAFDNFVRSTIKQQSIPVMLTGLVPIIEGMTNYSFFRDAPIVPQREAYLNKEDQFDTYTSELSKKVAGGLTPILGEESNFTSPRIVDNTIRGVTAGLGGYALDIFDIILGKDTQKPAKNISQQPLLKGFLVNENSSGKSMETLYSDKDKLTREKNSAKLNKIPFNNQIGLKKATATSDNVGDLTKQIRDVTNSKTLTPEQKRLKINELVDLRNKLTRDYKQGK